MLIAARLADTATERPALLETALTASIATRRRCLPTGWRRRATATKASSSRASRGPRLSGIDQLESSATPTASARAADVRSLAQLVDRVRLSDQALGGQRPETVATLIAAVEARLDAARRLRLARDRWALRAPEFRQYRAAIRLPWTCFAALEPSLQQIKLLAGSSPSSLTMLDESRSRRFWSRRGRFRRPRSSARHMRCSSAPSSWPEAPARSGARPRSPRTSRARGTPRRPPPAPSCSAPAPDGYAEPAPSAATPVITPRRTRLVRVPDLHAFRHAIVGLSLAGDPARCVAGRPGSDRAARPVSSGGRCGRRCAGARDTRRVLRSLHARLDSPPRRLTAYDRDVMVQAAARDAAAARRRPAQLAAAAGSRRRDAALLRPAAAPGATGRALRGAARRGAVERRGARSRRGADARSDALSGGDLPRIRAARARRRVRATSMGSANC